MYLSMVGRQSCHSPCGFAYNETGGRLLTAPVTAPCAYAFDRVWTGDGVGDGGLCRYTMRS